MAINFVQRATLDPTTDSGAGQSTTFASATTTGNLIVVAVTFRSDTGGLAGSPCTVTDNKGNTFSRITGTDDVSANFRTDLFYAKNVTGGSGHTITATPPALGYVGIWAGEYNGADPTSPVRTSDSAQSGSPTAIPVAAALTTVVGDFAVAAVAYDTGTTAAAVSPYTLNYNFTTFQPNAYEHCAVVSGTSITPEFSLGAAATWAIAAAIFIPAPITNSGNSSILIASM